MQNYTEIPSSTTLSDSLSQILNNDKTALSLSSGTAFPTVNLQLGRNVAVLAIASGLCCAGSCLR